MHRVGRHHCTSPANAAGAMNRMPEAVVSYGCRPPAVPVSVDPPEISVVGGAGAAMTAPLGRDPGRSARKSLTTAHEGGARSADCVAVPASLAFASGVAGCTAEFQAVNSPGDGDKVVLRPGGATPRACVPAAPQQQRWRSRISTSRLAGPWGPSGAFSRSRRTGSRRKLLLTRSNDHLAGLVDAAGRLGPGLREVLESEPQQIGRALASGTPRGLHWIERCAARGDRRCP